MSNSEKYVGGSTDLLYIWDDVYGWIHHSEKEKLEEAYQRFVEEHKDWFGNKTVRFKTSNNTRDDTL